LKVCSHAYGAQARYPDLPVSSTTPLIGSPSYARKLPFLQRFGFAVILHVVRFIIDIGLRLLNLPGIRDNSILPTFTRVYPCRPALTNRIFIPKSYSPGDAALPLYIDIHGGGFAWANPAADDRFCSTLSSGHNVLVVSLDYPKSPSHRYPAHVQALTDLVNAVLGDDTLPIDRSKVAIGGFSAGANLALAASQDKTLQGKLGGIVAFYAAVNFSSKRANKTALPRNAGSVLPQSQLTMFSWGYVKEGQDLTDPQLSPTFAPRQNLPPKMYLIGCELDLLCRESEVMAEKMASEGTGQRTGSDIAWEQNGVKWEKVLGEDHGMSVAKGFFWGVGF
jgi:acetyl esterase/lipase